MGNKPINKPLRGIRDNMPPGYIVGRTGNGAGPPILLPITNFASKSYVAGTTIQVGGAAGGDLSGSYPNPTVAKINGNAVKAGTPSNNQVLTYITADTEWEPETPHYIPAGGTTGQVLEKNSGTDYDVSWDTPAGSSGAPASIQDTGTAIDLAISDSSGQLVLDGSGNPIFAPEVFPASAIPAPTATTLGGVKSLAAVTSKWINTISTAGQPAATQPAFTDLSDCAQGTWTPTDASGAGLTLAVAYANYQKVGNVVFFVARVTYPSTASGANALVGGLPYTVGTACIDFASGNASGVMPARTNPSSAATTCEFYVLSSGTQITNANLSGAVLVFQGRYFI